MARSRKTSKTRVSLPLQQKEEVEIIFPHQAKEKNLRLIRNLLFT